MLRTASIFSYPTRDRKKTATRTAQVAAGSSQANEREPKLNDAHRKPYPEKDSKIVCEGVNPTRHLVLGTDFITDIALFSLSVEPPLSLRPGHSSTNVALRTVSEALAKAACQLLEIEAGELMAEFRPALTPEGKRGSEAEIFLYDTLAGGAGFSRLLADRGEELLKKALVLLKACPEACDASCYRCLRNYKNKFEHSLLDRHVGAELLEYLTTGRRPDFNAERLRGSTVLLYHDLLRQGFTGVGFELDAQLDSESGGLVAPILATTNSGNRFIIALSGVLHQGTVVDRLPVSPQLMILPGLPGGCLSSRHV